MGSAEVAPGAEGAFPRQKDVTGEGPGWRVVEYVDTGEATVWWAGPRGGSDRLPGESMPRPGENARRAVARARVSVRRYAVRNRLTRLWTFTYVEAQWDVGQVRRDVNAWAKRLRKHLDRSVPYVAVMELHPGGHGLHVHVLLPSRFVRHKAMRALWGKGHVQYSDGDTSVRRVKGQRSRARRAAEYVAKYVGKELGQAMGPGQHRYEVGEGFQPEQVRRSVRSEFAGLRWLCERRGGELPVLVWSSDDLEDWRGPPVRVLTWL